MDVTFLRAGGSRAAVRRELESSRPVFQSVDSTEVRPDDAVFTKLDESSVKLLFQMFVALHFYFLKRNNAKKFNIVTHIWKTEPPAPIELITKKKYYATLQSSISKFEIEPMMSQ